MAGAGKFKMLHRVLTLRFFLLKCMLYMQYVKYDLVLINVRRLFTNERPLKDVCIRLLPDKISHSFLHIPPVLWVRIA